MSLRAQVELSNSEANLIRSKNAINIARADLIKTMGVSQDSNFMLSDTFALRTRQVPMEEAVRPPLRIGPTCTVMNTDTVQQREQLRIARSRYLPNVSAYFTETWAEPQPHEFRQQLRTSGAGSGRRASSGASPIFDGFQREGDIMQQKARLKRAQIRLVDTEETAVSRADPGHL